MHSATRSSNDRISHSQRGYFAIAVATVGLSVFGCRSGRPTNSMVQVTEDPTAIVTDVPAPEQRLATTTTGKPSTGTQTNTVAAKTDLAGSVTGMPAVFREKKTGVAPSPDAMTRMSLSDKEAKSLGRQSLSSQNPRPSTSAIANSLTDSVAVSPSQSKANVSNTQSAKKHRAAQVTDTSVEVTSSGLVSASLTDLSVQEKQEPPKQQPQRTAQPDSAQPDSAQPDSAQPDSAQPDSARPDAARPANDHSEEKPQNANKKTSVSSSVSETTAEPLVKSSSSKRAAIRRPFSQTDQPRALTQALEQSLSSLPKLPRVKQRPDGPLPQRLGTGKQMLAKLEPRSAVDSEETRPEPKAPVRPEREASASPTHVGNLVAASSAATVTEKPLPSEGPDQVDEEPSVVMNANQVRPVSHAGDDEPFGVVGHTSPTPIEAIPTKVPARELSEDELYGQLLRRLSNPPADESPIDRERRQIVLRHLMVLAGQPENAIESMEGLNKTEQLYLTNQLMGLWTMINPQGHPSSGRRITEALPKFREATRHMATATDSLTLNSLEFCTEIEAYGQIKPFDGNRFAAGQQVILYCEIENFAAAERSGEFQTKLQGSYDIYDSTGTKVISQLLPVDQQRSRNRLRDYFVAYQMNLPKGLPTGTYRLQLTIEDAVGKKYGQSNIPFEIR